MFYPVILWSVFLGVFLGIVGFDITTRGERSLFYKIIYRRKSIYDLANRIGPTVTLYIPTGKQVDLGSKLIYAGSPCGLTSESYIGIKAVLILIAIVIGLVLSSFGVSALVMILLVALALFFPDVLLNERVQKRQTAVRKDLPSMVGLLSTSVKAGVELSQAFEIISMNIPGILGEELRVVMKEVKTGSQRAKALKRMCDRVGVDILDRFIETINTAEERGGMNVSEVLEEFTQDIRKTRQLGMDEKANKLPTKMLVPIFAFIFMPMLMLFMFPVVITLSQTM